MAALALLTGTVSAQVPIAPAGKTLQAVRDRGHLICATTDPLPGFATRNDQGIWSGFDVDLCRAVAAAVFGDPSKVEFRALLGDSRFALLQTGAVDLMARNSAWTMRRDTGYQASYVAASFFDGLAIMVPSSLGVVSAYELDDISVCVIDGGDDLVNLRDFFFQNQATYTEVLYEDREDLAVTGLDDLQLTENDVVIALAASGRTPYAIAGLVHARKFGALTVGIFNNPGSKLGEVADIAVLLPTGIEFLAGSTRMKAGTSQKVALNIISTGIMIKLGYVYRGLMVEMRPTNIKLQDRAAKMVATLTGKDYDTSRATLDSADGSIKLATVMLTRQLSRADAEAALAANGNNLKRALA